MKKLTLNAEPEVIELARKLAKENGSSISSMFARIIRMLARRSGSGESIGPITRKASGVVTLPRGKTSRQVLEDALLQKYKLKK